MSHWGIPWQFSGLVIRKIWVKNHNKTLLYTYQNDKLKKKKIVTALTYGEDAEKLNHSYIASRSI